MPRRDWTPSIVPYGADQPVYLVVDSFGALGTAYRETDVERTDLETVVTDLMSGQFNDPVRVVAFNTAERWAQERLERYRPRNPVSLRYRWSRRSGNASGLCRAARRS